MAFSKGMEIGMAMNKGFVKILSLKNIIVFFSAEFKAGHTGLSGKVFSHRKNTIKLKKE